MTTTIDAQFREWLRHGTDGFPIGFYENELAALQDYTFPLHWHPEWEMLIAEEHALDIQVDQNHHLLEPGDGIFINGNILHGITQVSRAAYEPLPNIVFSSRVIAPEDSVVAARYLHAISGCATLPCVVFRRGCGWHEEVLGFLEKIFDHMRRRDICYEMSVQRCLSAIFEMLCRHFEELPRHEATRRQINAQVRIQKMLGYIHRHYAEPMTLDEMAAAAGISRSEAGRCFRNYMDCTPIEALNRHRLSAARSMLLETDFTLQQISMACGFRSEHYFSRMFSAFYGMTPGSMRKLGK